MILEVRQTQTSVDQLKFIGTATTLLTLDGHRILIDPSFLHSGSRYHLGWGIFSTKLVDPVYEETDLNVDLVLLSHNHRDHWDEEATRLLPKDVEIITNPSAAIFLEKKGFTAVTALDAHTSVSWKSLIITALPAEHGPWFIRPFTGKVIGFGITTASYKLWVSGDTIATQPVQDAVTQFQPDKAVIYFGSVRVYGIRITFNAADALKVVGSIEQLKQIIGVHINDWSHFRSKPDQLLAHFQNHGLDLLLPEHGDIIDLE